MFRIPLAGGGHIEVDSPALEAKLARERQQIEVAEKERAEAEQRWKSVVYRIGGEPDPDLPFGGLLTKRLQCAECTARDLIQAGKLRYFLVGKKGYRVTEDAVREYQARNAA